MGANCCVPARDKPLTNGNVCEVSNYRTILPSPSWSFRWHSRTHIEDIAENMLHFSHHNSGNATSEVKSVADTETDGLSDTESPPKSFQSSQWRKSFISGGSGDSKLVIAGDTTAGSLSPEGNGSIQSPCLPSTSFLSSVANPSPFPPPAITDDDPSSSKLNALHSPAYQLCRQISNSRIPSLKSLNEYSSTELGQHSFDLSAEGSHGGSSDGWSMRTFSELVASSQRERWSFDSHENLSSFTSKLFASNIQPKTTHTRDPQTCGICSKPLMEKSPWSAHKIMLTSDFPIAAVLFCGHVYHSDCLESCTSAMEMYDPPCPVCINDCERSALKPLGKIELKGGRSKISRISDADMRPDSVRKNNGKNPVMGASSSVKGSLFAKPFLRRRFSMGPRPVRSASESEATRKKKFWSKSRRE